MSLKSEIDRLCVPIAGNLGYYLKGRFTKRDSFARAYESKYCSKSWWENIFMTTTLPTTEQHYFTEEQYLALEETAEDKSEYLDGEIIPMTAGSTNHNQIAGNLYIALSLGLKKQNYRIFIGDVRLWVPKVRLYTYPDVMVIFGIPEYHNNRTDMIANPQVIVEVLSKSTKNYDRGDKFTFYKSIPTL